MPKFSQIEKDAIKADLLKQGEKLFTANGLKKVTIDDLVRSVKIAKATFYTFFENKEALYLEIASTLQKNIFKSLVLVLENNKEKSAKDRVREVFYSMHQMLKQYPMLAQIDTETVQLVARRVSPERLQEFTQSNYNAAEIMNSQGIRFKCETQIASESFQAIYHGWIYLQSKEYDTQQKVIDILLNGVLDRIL